VGGSVMNSGIYAFISGHLATMIMSFIISRKYLSHNISFFWLIKSGLLIVIILFVLYSILNTILENALIQVSVFTLLLILITLLFYFKSNINWIVDLRYKISNQK
jgi:hypothetical protein